MSFWWYLLGGIIGALAVVTIYGVITEKVLKEQLAAKSNEAGARLYAIVTEVQPQKVKLSYYKNNGNHYDDAEYESSDGVSSSIYRGQRINMY